MIFDSGGQVCAAASVEISVLEALVSTAPLALSTLVVCAITLAAKCKTDKGI